MTLDMTARPKRVMLVESEDSLAQAVDHLVATLGHACARLSPGDRIVDRVTAEHPDLLMLDLTHADRAQVLDACQSIRRRPALADVKILMVQKTGRALDRRLGRALGADGMVSLPFRLDELRAEMRRLLGDETPVH